MDERCPFCDGAWGYADETEFDRRLFWVECTECYARTVDTDSEEAALALWRRRVRSRTATSQKGGPAPTEWCPRCGLWAFCTRRQVYDSQELGDHRTLYWLVCVGCGERTRHCDSEEEARALWQRRPVLRCLGCGEQTPHVDEGKEPRRRKSKRTAPAETDAAPELTCAACPAYHPTAAAMGECRYRSVMDLGWMRVAAADWCYVGRELARRQAVVMVDAPWGPEDHG